MRFGFFNQIFFNKVFNETSVVIFSLALFVFIVFIPASGIYAADLSFSSLAGSYQTGKNFSVSINVNSINEVMNGASGVVSFPSDKLEVVSISKTGSIFTLWVQEPTFSNVSGTVSFEGIVLNPGFSGYEGKIMTITFRTKSTGDAVIKFASGSVLANDGYGTNILKTMRPVSVSIVSKTMTAESLDVSATPATTATENAAMADPGGFKIVSKTHPDQKKWYVNNSPELSWTLPEGTQEVRTILSPRPDSLPIISYDPPITNKKIDDLEDGVYYFAIQARDSDGWGPVSRFKINIDTVPPKAFQIIFPHGNRTLEPQPIIFFNTSDNYSGISHYNVEIGSGGPIRLASVLESNPYPLPSQFPGDYTVVVTAYDQAGNIRVSTADFTIEAIDTPKVTDYQPEIEVGDILKIRGVTYANSDVNIYIREGANLVTEEYTRSNSLGDFAVIVGKKLDKGQYTFTVRVKDNRGATSNESEPLTVNVGSNIINDIASILINYLSLIILGFILVAGSIFVGIIVWSRLSKKLKIVKEESRQAEAVIRKSFDSLRKDIKDHVDRLNKAEERRKLTREEVVFLEKFEKELTEAENTIEEGVEKVIKKKD